MDILVLYKCYRLRERRTVKDHLYSFSHYVDGCRFVYLDVGRFCGIPRCIATYPFDAVVFHYTFLAIRFNMAVYGRLYDKVIAEIQSMQGVKVMIPHDEYVHTDALWRLAKDGGLSRIYCSCYPQDYATIFPPEKTGGTDICRTVLTDYVDERLLRSVQRIQSRDRKRAWDVGYRALRSSYIFGRHGQLKTQVAEEFLVALKRYPALRADIRMTENGYKNTLVGNRWIRFLLSCRATIGCLGGSSLFDPDGSLLAKTVAYVDEHPGAGYEDVAAHCYPGLDGKISTFLLGPKHFECAMTRTCQLLVEGDYHGVLEPGRDYIEVKRDFSNLDAVLSQIADEAVCKRIAEQCYADVVESGKYTYRAFANGIVDDLRALCKEIGLPEHSAGQSAWRILHLRCAAFAVLTVNLLGNTARHGKTGRSGFYTRRLGAVRTDQGSA